MKLGGIVPAMQAITEQLEKNKPFIEQGVTVVYRATDNMPHTCVMPKNTGVTWKDAGMIVQLSCGHYAVLRTSYELMHISSYWCRVSWWMLRTRLRVWRANRAR